MTMYHEILSHLQMFFGKNTNDRLTPDEQAAIKRLATHKSQEAESRRNAAEAKARLPKAA